MLHVLPSPSYWLLCTTEGIMFVSSQAGGVVYAVIEPRGNRSWQRAGFEQNDTTIAPKDASYFLLPYILSSPWLVLSCWNFTAFNYCSLDIIHQLDMNRLNNVKLLCPKFFTVITMDQITTCNINRVLMLTNQHKTITISVSFSIFQLIVLVSQLVTLQLWVSLSAYCIIFISTYFISDNLKEL